MNRFAAENTGIRFEINVSNRRVDLVEEQYDLTIRVDGVEQPQLEEEVLWKVRSVVCASPAFWRKHGFPETPEDLIGLPTLAYRTDSAG